ncbi:MAG: DUF1667 domain-containing protein [Actinomycetota bacterium]|nr:DUF1667 domain-containing protein [Actinomycetota bacterium]
MRKTFVCIVCPVGCPVTVDMAGGEIGAISGLLCKKGEDFVRQEAISPVRLLFTTIPIDGAKDIDVLPVRSGGPLPKHMLSEAMDEMAKIKVRAPVKIGDIIVRDFMGHGVNIISSRTVKSRGVD